LVGDDWWNFFTAGWAMPKRAAFHFSATGLLKGKKAGGRAGENKGGGRGPLLRPAWGKLEGGCICGRDPAEYVTGGENPVFCGENRQPRSSGAKSGEII